MKHVILAAAVLAASTSFAAAEVGSATLGDISGKVLVNSGKGFVAATASTILRDGDKVMVGEQAFATLSYSGCSLALSKPAVVTVSSETACADAAAVQITPTADLDSGYVAPILPLPLILLGGAAAIGGVILISDVLDEEEEEVAVSEPVVVDD
jgi:hypothetical protein